LDAKTVFKAIYVAERRDESVPQVVLKMCAIVTV